MERLRELFDQLDLDRDGAVSAEEFRRGMVGASD